MSSTTEILAKWKKLKDQGVDLGSKIGSEQDADSGGRVQVYQNGRIYWHTNTGAHDVSGGILEKYLKLGGPGQHPTTNRREFGYPITDRVRTRDGLYTVVRFEFGEIIWVRGSGGGVGIYGDFFQVWNDHGSEIGNLLHPLTDPIPVAGGEAVYFERGCMWRGPATNGKIITGTFRSPPLLGKPKLINPSEVEVRFSRFVGWWRLPKQLYESILQKRPSLFSEIWNGRLAVRRVMKYEGKHEVITLEVQGSEGSEDPETVTIYITFVIPTKGPVPLRDRSLYDLCLRLPNNKVRAVAPHALYTKNSWEEFGFIHVTDIHVAKRIEGFQKKINGIATQYPELAHIETEFNNFNDNFRDFIRYANHLHNIGMLDFILATGDLVDYGFENGEHQSYGGSNYAFFEQLIRGQIPSASGVSSEELHVPIFTVFGNHDYRIHPYKLLFQLDVPDSFLGIDGFVNTILNSILPLPDWTVEMYKSYNLNKDETKALQGGKPASSTNLGELFMGGKPKISKEEAFRMIEVDTLNQRHSYDYYHQRINSESSYILELGPHRIVMLDTRSDAGLPTSADWNRIIPLFLKWIFNGLGENTQRAIGSGPNQKGFKKSDIQKVKQALSEADKYGIVIIGSHAPPINIERSEFAHYFRETEHPTAEKREIYAFLLRNMSLGKFNAVMMGASITNPGTVKKICDIVNGQANNDLSDTTWERIEKAIDNSHWFDDWLQEGTKYFKVGSHENLLDASVALGETEALLKACAGIDVTRPVDMILCGHNHDRIEYRLKWNKNKQEFRFFTDFYLENPNEYYPSIKFGVKGEVHLRVTLGGSLNDEVKSVPISHGIFSIALLRYKQLEIPPYANPLDKVFHKPGWWEEHRPLIVETAALGPLDQHQRPKLVKTASGMAMKSSATFQGFRCFQVEGNVIHKGHYITLKELNENDFQMPWEKSYIKDHGSIHGGSGIANGGSH